MNCPKCSSTLPDDSEFCSFCGEKIVNAVANKEIIKLSKKRIKETKKETRNSSRFAIRVLSSFVALLIVSTIAFASLYFSSENKYKKAIEEYKEIINAKNSTITSIMAEKDKLESQLSVYNIRYKEKADFLDERISFVVSNSNYYHTYDCDYFKGTFWAYNTEAAEYEGYKPCPICHKN